MGRIEAMLLGNALIMTDAEGRRSYIEGSVLSGSLVVRNADGRVTHRVERAANGVDFVVRNTATGLVEARLG